MAEYEGFSEADFDQIPCEFCDELFPFELLMEHQSGCRPDLLHYNMDLVVPTARVASPQKAKEPAVMTDTENAILDNLSNFTLTTQKKTDVLKQSPTKNAEEEKHTSAVKPIVVDKKNADLHIPSFDDKENDSIITFDDPIMQETGTKLMAYGSNLNRNKRMEEEKPTFRAPPLPLLNNSDHKEVEENILSDNDDEESLEDFWRRADVKNAQRLRKIQA